MGRIIGDQARSEDLSTAYKGPKARLLSYWTSKSLRADQAQTLHYCDATHAFCTEYIGDMLL